MFTIVWVVRADASDERAGARIGIVENPFDYKDATEKVLCEMGIQDMITLGELLALEHGQVMTKTGLKITWLVGEGVAEI